MKLKGYTLAALAAAAYGTNPAFAVPLYEQGLNPNSVLLLRYVAGVPLVAAIALGRGQSLRVGSKQLMLLALLGILMALSSLALFASYELMNAGIASTLLFIYPVLVAMLMVCFFHERFTPSTALCLAVMGAGLALLFQPSEGAEISATGCIIIFCSALLYAVYIVLIKASPSISSVPTSTMLFYVLLTGSLLFAVLIPFGNPLILPTDAAGWSYVAALALIPTVISLWCTTAAIQLIGSTPTAIFGALEPVNAVILSVFALGQPITPTEICGGVLIILATTLVVVQEPVNRALNRVRRLFPRRHHA